MYWRITDNWLELTLRFIVMDHGVREVKDEAERAREALATHLRGRPMPVDAKAMQRVGMYLMRRGFDADVVRSTLRAASVDLPPGDE